ncbi:hypothetical protein PQX77_021085, partial [Marasmius sp. AFHP31]
MEQFVQEQMAGMPPVIEGVSLHGQVVIITGANVGLGYEAAKHFAIREPAKLIMVCRSEKKGQDALEKLKSETGFQNIELWILDLGSFSSIVAIKDKIDRLERLDMLVENAAVCMYQYEVTGDGWETTLQVNVLGIALHIILHLPKLLETAKKHSEHVPRVVMVSSNYHHWETFSAEAIQADNTLKFINAKDQFGGAEKRYAESKLLGVMFIRALQSHLPTVTCCSVHPGFCDSELTRHARGEDAEKVRQYKSQMAFTCEEGSRPIVYASIGQRDREEELRAGYVAFNKVSECSDYILGEEGQSVERKVWAEVVELFKGRKDESVNEII